MDPAVIRTAVILRWVGRLVITWSPGGQIPFAMPYEGYPRLLPQFVPFLFGVVLLRPYVATPRALNER